MTTICIRGNNLTGAPRTDRISSLALSPWKFMIQRGLQPNRFRQSLLALVEGSEVLRLEFHRTGDIQSVQRSHADRGAMAVGRFCAQFECEFWHRNLSAKARTPVGDKLIIHRPSVSRCQVSSKFLLGKGMCPLRAMKIS